MPYNINSFFKYWSQNVSEEKRKIILLNLNEDNFKKENDSWETIKNVSEITLGIGLGLLGIAGICVVGVGTISLIHKILNSQIILKGIEFLYCSCDDCKARRIAEGFNLMLNFVSETKTQLKIQKAYYLHYLNVKFIIN